jgi:DNA-binding NarL/FixJ family response regulator
MTPIRILLADDHRTVREGLRLMLERQPDIEVIGEAGSGPEAVHCAETLKPDIVIMDIAMPEGSGLTATRALRQKHPEVKVVMLTRYSDDAYFQELLRAGVSGYILKQSASTELLHAVRAVAQGGEYLDSALTSRVTGRFRTTKTSATAPGMSEREREVLRLIAWGYSNKEIAANLDLSVKTVEVHKANAMRKLGMKSRIDIVRFAVVQGWLQDS